jgi:hypothetical protein
MTETPYGETTLAEFRARGQTFAWGDRAASAGDGEKSLCVRKKWIERVDTGDLARVKINQNAASDSLRNRFWHPTVMGMCTIWQTDD